MLDKILTKRVFIIIVVIAILLITTFSMLIAKTIGMLGRPEGSVAKEGSYAIFRGTPGIMRNYYYNRPKEDLISELTRNGYVLERNVMSHRQVSNYNFGLFRINTMVYIEDTSIYGESLISYNITFTAR